MAFKQRSSGLPFKEIGSSPAKQKGFDIKSEKAKNKRDFKKTSFDLGTTGAEPPVRREELDAKGKAIYDAHRAKKKESPAKQNGDKLDKAKGKKKATKDTRTPSQKAAEKRDLDRQTRIYHAQEKNRKYHAKREQKELKEKGYYTDATDGKNYEHAEEMRGTGKNRKMTKFAREKRD